jgi:hypothetical protein
MTTDQRQSYPERMTADKPDGLITMEPAHPEMIGDSIIGDMGPIAPYALGKLKIDTAAREIISNVGLIDADRDRHDIPLRNGHGNHAVELQAECV